MSILEKGSEKSLFICVPFVYLYVYKISSSVGTQRFFNKPFTLELPSYTATRVRGFIYNYYGNRQKVIYCVL